MQNEKKNLFSSPHFFLFLSVPHFFPNSQFRERERNIRECSTVNVRTSRRAYVYNSVQMFWRLLGILHNLLLKLNFFFNIHAAVIAMHKYAILVGLDGLYCAFFMASNIKAGTTRQKYCIEYVACFFDGLL